MTAESYSTWSLVFQFFTALGTVGAVIVALILANQKDKPTFLLRCGITKLFKEDEPESDYGEGVYVAARNVGVRPETVHTYWFSILAGSTKVDVFEIPALEDTNYEDFPARLKPGEEATSLIKIDDFKLDVVEKFVDRVKRTPGISTWCDKSDRYLSLMSHTMKCTAYTARNTKVTIRLNEQIQQIFFEAYKARNNR